MAALEFHDRMLSLGLARGTHGTDGGPVIIPVPVHDFIFAPAPRINPGSLPDDFKRLFIGFRAGV